MNQGVKEKILFGLKVQFYGLIRSRNVFVNQKTDEDDQIEIKTASFVKDKALIFKSPSSS